MTSYMAIEHLRNTLPFCFDFLLAELLITFHSSVQGCPTLKIIFHQKCSSIKLLAQIPLHPQHADVILERTLTITLQILKLTSILPVTLSKMKLRKGKVSLRDLKDYQGINKKD